MDTIFTNSDSERLYALSKRAIDIVIVNWNSGYQLCECLKSIQLFGGEWVSNVIVVDNASRDKSWNCEELNVLGAKLIRNEKNKGFAAACNQGAANSKAPYLLFLNPDAKLFDNSLVLPLALLEKEENHNVGICGIQLMDSCGKVARSCARFPTIGTYLFQIMGLNRIPWFKSWNTHMTYWDHSSSRKVDHVIGAFFFVRRFLFEQIGGFDERFFVYLEDLDFSLRAQRLGYSSYYLAESKAFHVGGGTSGQIKARRLFYSLRSRLYYGFKHFTLTKSTLLLFATITIEPITRLVFCLSQARLVDCWNTVCAYGMLIRDLKAICINAFTMDRYQQ